MSLQDDRTGIPTARLVNRIVTAARTSIRLALGDGLQMEHTTGGRVLSAVGLRRSFFARLVSGTGTGPFHFRRVRQKNDVWVDIVPRDDRAVAYEANLHTVTVPRIVTMRDVGLAKEYRFFTPRNPGAVVLRIYTVTVRGCSNLLLAGATVTLSTGGTTTATGTTNTSGVATLSVPDGTYTLAVSGTGWSPTSQTVTITANAGITVTMTTVLSTHVCTACNASPIPRNLTASDVSTPNGTISVPLLYGTYAFQNSALGVFGASFTGWKGCHDFAVHGTAQNSGTDCIGSMDISTSYVYIIRCVSISSTQRLQLTVYNEGCPGFGNTGYPITHDCSMIYENPNGISSVPATGASFNPVNLTYSWQQGQADPGAYPPIGHAVTVTS